MKKTLLANLLLTVVLSGNACWPGKANAQTIPNGGFENWQTAAGTEKLNDGWTISDEIVTGCTPLSSVKSTDAASGNYSLFLQTANCPGAGGKHEGWAVITFPVSSKPMYLNFKYKSQHQGPDSAHVYVRLNKRVGATRQKLVEQTYFIKGNQTSYKSVSMPLNYLINDVPDTAIIDISSDGGANPAIGNKLWIDDLDFSLVSDVPDVTNDQPSVVFPNPVANMLHIGFAAQGEEAITVSISDMTGRVLDLRSFAAYEPLEIKADNLARGMYFYCVRQGSRVSAGRFIKL